LPKRKKSQFSDKFANTLFCWTHVKPFLQCFTCRRTYSGSQVVAEKYLKNDESASVVPKGCGTQMLLDHTCNVKIYSANVFAQRKSA